MKTLAELKKDYFEKQRLYEAGVSPAEGGVTLDELFNHPWHEAMSMLDEHGRTSYFD